MKKSYTIEISTSTFWTLLVPITVLCMIFGGLCGIFIVDRFVMPNITDIKNRGVVKVPEILNLKLEAARQELYDIGLRLQIQSWQYNDTVDKDVVVSQNPPPEQNVKKGRHIFVEVSKGKEIGKIPAVAAMTERNGKKVLREAGFSNIRVYKSYSEKYDKDIIAMTNPSRGTVISREVCVEITVSKGPKPTHAEVPNVIGEALSEAKRLIEESGLKVGSVEYRMNTQARPGSVISQSVSPGASAPLESPVNLVISASQ